MESLYLFNDVLPTLEMLVEMDITIGICSNLATPYGEVIERLLSGFSFITSLSYEVGAIKPEPPIYRRQRKLGLSAILGSRIMTDPRDTDSKPCIWCGKHRWNGGRSIH